MNELAASHRDATPCRGCDGRGFVIVDGPFRQRGVILPGSVVEVCACGECNGTGHVDTTRHAWFSVPWPPEILSPNGSHGHWFAKARAKRAYRDACFLATKAARCPRPRAQRLDLLLQFVPPTRRQYDRDNLLARFKSGLDGIARALGIDDARFVRVAAEVVETVTPAKAAAEVRVEVREHVEAAP